MIGFTMLGIDYASSAFLFVSGIIVLLDSVCYSLARVEICFPKTGVYKNFYPPQAVTSDPSQIIYSVSINQVISRPIIAQLCEDGKGISTDHPDYSTRKAPKVFSIESLDPDAASKNNTTDFFKGTLKLCQYSSNNYPITDPRRYDRASHFSRKVCSEIGEPSLINITFFKNLLVAQGLFHEMTDIPPYINHVKRIFRFKYVTHECKLSYKDTEQFEIITKPATSLKWVTQPPSTMTANTPFAIKLEIVDDNGNTIKNGLDSTLFVEVTVAYSNKYFLVDTRVENFLYSTEVMMNGTSVVTSVQNYDRILRKRAVNGVVEFDDIRLLDVTERVFLNATLIVPRTNIRQPDNYEDLKKPSCRKLINATSVEPSAMPGLKILWFSDICSVMSRPGQPVVFSDPIVTIEQTATKLKLHETSPIPKAAVNFEIPNMLVEVLDVYDRRVHSGPGSSLLVTMKGSKDLCIKNSTFKTFRGVGRFRGSICEVVTDVTFTFEATSLSASNSSASYNITNDIHIAMFGDLCSRSVDGVDNPSTETFAELAVEDINAGYYDKEFPNLKGRTLVLDAYDTDSDYQVVFKELSRMISLAETDFSRDVKAIIGFGSNDVLEAVAPILEIHDIPVISYMEDKEELSQQRGQELFRTVTPISWNSISVAINLVLMLTYRNWKKIVVIASSHHPIPRPIFRKFFIFNIDYQLISISYLDEDKWKPDALKEEFEIISNAGTKIIFHYVHSPMQYFLYRQAIKFGCASVDGYQWITIERPACQTLNAADHTICTKESPSCVEGMEGMIIIRGTYNVRGFSTDTWFHVNNRYYGMDPVLHYGIPTSTTTTSVTLPSTNVVKDLGVWFSADLKSTGHPLKQCFPTIRLVVATRVESSAIALGYDAVLTLAYAFNALFGKGASTTNGSVIVEEISKVKFVGLTGHVSFADRRRLGFIGEVSSIERQKTSKHKPMGVSSRWTNLPENLELFIINKHEEILEWTAGVAKMDQNYKYSIGSQVFKVSEQVTQDCSVFAPIIPKDWYSEVSLTVPLVILPSVGKPVGTSMSLKMPNASNMPICVRYYVSKKGTIHSETHKLKGSGDVTLRTEYIVLPFSCPSGCGGDQLHIWNCHEFANGVCVGPANCRCKTVGEVDSSLIHVANVTDQAYDGETCNRTICYACHRGECIKPLTCACHKGWEGEHCNKPICTEKCIHGICIGPDTCQCDMGYHGSNCNVLVGAIVMAILLMLVIAIVLLVVYFKWRRRRKKAKNELRSFGWLVEWKDVKEDVYIRDIRAFSPDGSTGSNTSQHERVQAGQDLSLENLGLGTERGRGIVIQHVRHTHRYVEWKDQECFLQKFDRSSLDMDDMTFRLEVIHLKELKHPNLAHFLGVCVTHPNVCLLVEIVPKGSLDEILQSTTFNLTWDFKYSILRDICSGMDYLHASKLVSHGRLKSPNCLIDNRWTCKISGFGIPTMRNVQYSISDFSAQRRALLWTAPELLRIYSTPSEVRRGTKHGDSYSFGIIITEMCAHAKPWHSELKLLSVEELLSCLQDLKDEANKAARRTLDRNNYDTKKPLRPYLFKQDFPNVYAERKGLQKLTADLLNEDMMKRPTFKETASRLNSILPLKGELVENLIDMLEKYTNELEGLLSEKMVEIHTEKQKTEELIARLLPATIAEQLKQNREVMPQKHDDVSIFFSDIKGFTAIAKESTPMQVVSVLNDLYTAFDNVIESHDAYKLETVGDAYCVVSGIPSPNHKHAIIITSLALEISTIVDHFAIPHLPGRMLECRIGINSGSVVTGVLGVKMPRYCIFGVDVIIASQMESTGKTHKVHVSENTAKLLKKSNNFTLEYRGIILIKSVGPMKTYFVTRKVTEVKKSTGSKSSTTPAVKRKQR